MWQSLRRLQRPRHIRSGSLLQPATACNTNSSYSDNNSDYKGNRDSDGSESPRLAKRRRPSPSNSDPTSKRTCKHFLRQSHKSHIVPVQTQLNQSPSISDGSFCQPKMAPTLTSAGNQESLLNTNVEYQEWSVAWSLRTSDY
jgi:hypothetical protein